jgi:hypothetical protein
MHVSLAATLGPKAMKVALIVVIFGVAMFSASVSRMFGQPKAFAPLPTKQMPPVLVP